MERKLGEKSHQCRRRQEAQILLSGHVPLPVGQRASCGTLERLRDFGCVEPLSDFKGSLCDPSHGMGCFWPAGRELCHQDGDSSGYLNGGECKEH